MRRLASAIAAVPFVLVVAVIAAELIAQWPHDRRLDELKAAFEKLEHPPGSRQLAFESQLGLLQGNGNHCDYFVGALRAGMPPIVYRDPDVEVLVLDGAVQSDWFAFPPRDRLIELAKQQSVGPDEVLYVVSLVDQTPPGNDFRCH
jgi:hypothetical protein